MLADKPWSSPVYVAIGDCELVAVSTTARAAQVLVYRWPDKSFSSREPALEACLAVLTEGRPPELSRQAFIRAAKEAGLLINQARWRNSLQIN
jgi:hypothetical protein